MNRVRIIGSIKEEFKLLYEYKRERFYVNYIECERKSGILDVLPLVISEAVTDLNQFKKGDTVEVAGEVRSRNDEHRRLKVYLFVRDMYESSEPDSNRVELSGHICKPPVYRMTPLGREITDIILAVNRRHGADFIPVIVWGRAARVSEQLQVGDKVEVIGRLQSREHNKGVSYEISAIEISGY